MRMTAAMVGAAVYIAMVGGGGMDVSRRSSRLGNRVSLMWATDGRTALVSFEGGAIACTGKQGGRCYPFRAESAHGRGTRSGWARAVTLVLGSGSVQ